MARTGITREQLAVVIESHRLQAMAAKARAVESEALAESLEWDHGWLAAPGDYIHERSTSMSGEIRDGRGHHPLATFSWVSRK